MFSAIVPVDAKTLHKLSIMTVLKTSYSFFGIFILGEKKKASLEQCVETAKGEGK